MSTIKRTVVREAGTKVNAPLWATRLVYLLCAGGAVVTSVAPQVLPMLPVLVPDPRKQAGITVLLLVLGAVNHQVAGMSFPDGTPVTTATAKVTATETTPAGEKTQVVEVHTDTPQPLKEPAGKA